ncbi:unnamed protein product [Sphagnum balticum]
MVCLIKYLRSLPEGVGSVGSENRPISSMAGPTSGSENRKSELSISEEVALGPPDFILLVEDSSSDDGDSVFRSPVVSTHLSVELTDCTV